MNQNQTPMNQTNTSDIQTLVERDRGMMVELEKMKEERRRIIESLTKDDKMITLRSDQQFDTQNKNKVNFDMIRSEFKTDSKGYKTTERTKSTNKNQNKLKMNNSVNNIKNNNDHSNQENELKKQLSFSNIMKSKKPSVAEELIKKQQSELTFKPKTNKLPE